MDSEEEGMEEEDAETSSTFLDEEFSCTQATETVVEDLEDGEGAVEEV